MHAAETFIVAEEENLVLDDRTATGDAKLVLTQGALGNATGIFEEVGSVEFVVAEEFPGRAMKLLVPDLIVAFKTAAPERPNSALKLEVCTLNS